MLLVSTDRLSPGVSVAVPVPHPQRAGTCLLQPNVELTSKLIRRLRELRIPTVWVKHRLLQDLAQKINRRIPERRWRIFESVSRGFDDLQNRVITTADHSHYCEVISELITDLLEDSSQVGVLAERLFSDDDELSVHCSNVAYLAVTVGMHLESYILQQRGNARASGVRELCHMGVGALLHDIGKVNGPKELRKLHATSSTRHESYDRHVNEGFVMLRNRVNALAGTVALHHHQRWDGTGWPDMTDLTHGRFVGGMRGSNVHIFARIVAAANAFDTLAGGPGGEIMPAIYSLHRMQSDEYAGAFDPVILNAFLRYIPPFPVGVEVTLSNGRPAAVVGMHPDHPCRPTVRLIDGTAQPAEELDLRQHPALHICQSQGHNVERWLYDTPRMAEALAHAEA